MKKLHSFILTQLDDGSHLETLAILDSDTAILIQTPCYLLSDSLKTTLTPPQTLIQTNSILLKLIHSHLTWMMAAILNTAILNSAHFDSAILHKTLTQTNSIWLKLNSFSDSTWWCQPSWILPSWIQTLPSWIQTPCYLLGDSLRNTLTPLQLWLKLIQSD